MRVGSTNSISASPQSEHLERLRLPLSEETRSLSSRLVMIMVVIISLLLITITRMTIHSRGPWGIHA